MDFSQKIFFILLIFTIIPAISCKKDKTGKEDPVVNSFSVTGNNFISTDTIDFTLSVSDDLEVKTVSVYIADNNWNPVTPSKTYSINKQAETISDSYTYSDRYLENHSYFFICSVSDGERITRSPYSITIQPLSREVDDYLILAEDNGIYKLGKINSNLDSVVFSLPLSVRATDIACNSFSRQVAVLFEDGSVKAYSYPDLSEKWTYTGLKQTGIIYKGSLEVIGNLFACGTGFGTIFFFDESGTIRNTVSTSPESSVQCIKFAEKNGKIISFNEGYMTGTSRLTVSSFNGGGIINTYPTSTDIRHISLYDDPYVIAWTLDKVYTYNCENPFLYEISSYPVTPLNDAVYLSGNGYLLCFDNSLYTFYPQSEIYTQVLTGGGIAVFNEEVNGVIAIINGQNISFYNNFSLLKQINAGCNPVKIDFMYNK